MFKFSPSKNTEPKIKDIVWMTETAKWNGIVEIRKKDPSVVIICWFNETLRHAELFTNETISDSALLVASQVHSSQLTGKSVLFAEHYPLRQKEQELFQKLDLPEIFIHSALDEPLFKHFGGDKIVKMMKQLGMKERDSVQHKMISQSIVSAQEKIEQKLTVENTASSQDEWMKINLNPEF